MYRDSLTLETRDLEKHYTIFNNNQLIIPIIYITISTQFYLLREPPDFLLPPRMGHHNCGNDKESNLALVAFSIHTHSSF